MLDSVVTTRARILLFSRIDSVSPVRAVGWLITLALSGGGGADRRGIARTRTIGMELGDSMAKDATRGPLSEVVCTCHLKLAILPGSNAGAHGAVSPER